MNNPYEDNLRWVKAVGKDFEQLQDGSPDPAQEIVILKTDWEPGKEDFQIVHTVLYAEAGRAEVSIEEVTAAAEALYNAIFQGIVGDTIPTFYDVSYNTQEGYKKLAEAALNAAKEVSRVRGSEGD